ncbi:MAG: SPFH domain-containing protein, partial [Clostridia bacterium]|nr:SPFH domain-containing protein [Clostridia bacterium]
YSIRIVNPILFYVEAVPKNQDHVDIADINAQYMSEFLEALQASINQMSIDGIRISHVPSKSRELSRYMATTLDADWTQARGMEIQSVGIASISYDEDSQKLIHMRNQGAMLGDPSVREGYVQGAVARGIENAGDNPGGAGGAFMGVGIGMGVGGGFFGTASETNRRQMEAGGAPANTWTCTCGKTNDGKFCTDCGAAKPLPAGSWTCACGKVNDGNFCSDCGARKPSTDWTCSCGHVNSGRFCANCGNPRP